MIYSYLKQKINTHYNSQILIELSTLQLAKVRYFELLYTSVTKCPCASIFLIHFLVLKSKIRTVLSSLQE